MTKHSRSLVTTVHRAGSESEEVRGQICKCRLPEVSSKAHPNYYIQKKELIWSNTRHIHGLDQHCSLPNCFRQTPASKFNVKDPSDVSSECE